MEMIEETLYVSADNPTIPHEGVGKPMDSAPVYLEVDDAPVYLEPDDAPVYLEPDDAPVHLEPDDAPIYLEPDDAPVYLEPDDASVYEELEENGVNNPNLAAQETRPQNMARVQNMKARAKIKIISLSALVILILCATAFVVYYFSTRQESRAPEPSASCFSNPCQNKGTCSSNQCQCQTGYSGTNCESVINPWYDGECGKSKFSDVGQPVGQEARPHEFPWQVHLQMKGPDQIRHCGGTILNSRWVVTAAHCVSRLPNETMVYAGRHVRGDPDQYLQIRSVLPASTYFHEDFVDYLLSNDIALLQLPTPLDFNENVMPACSPYEWETYANMRAIISGWGIKMDDGPASDVLQYTSVLIQSNADCQAAVGKPVTADNLCGVDSLGTGRGTCQGDSGGPIAVQDVAGRFHVVGATSFGINGCGSEFPDFYTRFTYFFGWISSKVHEGVPENPWYANCLPFPCENGGFCVDIGHGYRCDCLLGFTGNECQTNIV